MGAYAEEMARSDAEGCDAGQQQGRSRQDYCTKLFEAERGIEHLPDSEHLEARQRICRPIVEEYYGWLDTLYHPAGKLKDAVTYALNQKAYLMVFLEHGEIEISNNQVENAIRPAVVGRKNWLFYDTPDGAKASAIIYSVIETAKANNLNPENTLLITCQFSLTAAPVTIIRP